MRKDAAGFAGLAPNINKQMLPASDVPKIICRFVAFFSVSVSKMWRLTPLNTKTAKIYLYGKYFFSISI